MKLALTAVAVPDPGGRSAGARRAFWALLRRVCTVAAGVHVVFLAVFASLGTPLLVWTNVASVALFVVSRALLERRRNVLAVSFILSEVVLHTTVATLLIGWDSGFHLYLLTLVGPLVVAMSGSTTSKFARLMLFGTGYALLDAWTRQVPPVYWLEPALLDALRYLNIAGMLAIMGFVALTYYRLVVHAENALRTLASTDPLTRLLNRRHLLEIVRSTRAAGPKGECPCVLICDIDHFKHVNDRHGHEAGDTVLQHVAAAITSAVRAGDSVARWGGEEFVVLLPGADVGTAMQTAERIRRAVAGLSLPLAGAGSVAPHGTGDASLADAGAAAAAAAAVGSTGPAPDAAAESRDAALRITITIGVAQVTPADSIDAAIARADAALYRGKAAGRDRVVIDGHAAGAQQPAA